MKLLNSYSLVFLFLSQTLLSHGQSNVARDARIEEQAAEIAVVALGPRPQRRYKETNEDSGPVMLLAQPGETPPSRLFYRDVLNREAERKWTALNLAFNNPASFRKISSGTELKLHRRLAGDEEEYMVYVALPAVLPASRTIFFLTPRKLGATPWQDNPVIRSLHLENSNLMDKQFLLANFSQHTVEHAFEDRVEIVKPNQVLTYQRDQVGQIYRLAARYGNEQKIIYNTAVRLNDEGHAQLFVLYDANAATNAGRDVGVFRMMIPAKKSEILP